MTFFLSPDSLLTNLSTAQFFEASDTFDLFEENEDALLDSLIDTISTSTPESFGLPSDAFDGLIPGAGNAVVPDSGPFQQVSEEFIQEFINRFGERSEALADFNAEEFEGLTPTINTSGSSSASMMGFDFSVTVNNQAGEEGDLVQADVVAVTEAALSLIADFIVGATGSVLDVAVTIAQQGESTVASASSGDFFIGDTDPETGIVEILTGSQIELITGMDPNGADPDIVITVNSDFLSDAAAFLSTDPNRDPPPGSIDYVSTLAHEIIHGLGFLSFRDNTGEDFLFDANGDGIVDTIESTYGLDVTFEEENGFLTPRFNGENVIEVYGESVVLESTFDDPGSDISHFAANNPDGTIADTALALLNPSVVGGDVTGIGVLELAVLRDLGFNIVQPDDLGLINEFDGLPFIPTVTETEIITDPDSGAVNVVVNLDDDSLFVNIPSSIGVEVTAGDGTTTQIARIRFGVDDLLSSLELSEEFLAAHDASGVDTISVRLFFPAQLQLPDGSTEQTLTLALESAGGAEGTPGDDVLTGTAGDDVINGLEGNDIINGEAGNDLLDGGLGNDNLFGGDGDDILAGSNGVDRHFGEAGNDTIIGGLNSDVNDGGDGIDTVDYSGATNTQTINLVTNANIGGFAQNDTNVSIENVIGSITNGDNITGSAGDNVLDGQGAADILRGFNGDDTLLGGEGNDFLFGGRGADTIDGGNGRDFVNYNDSSDAVIVDLAAGTASALGGFAGDDTITNVENVRGSLGDDTITGDDNINVLLGDNGNDTINGGGGRDNIQGGNGDDILSGGTGTDGLRGNAGNDVFVFSQGDQVDNILDFDDVGNDQIDLTDFDLSNISEVEALLQQTGDDVRLNFGNGDVLILRGTDIDDIDVAADFII